MFYIFIITLISVTVFLANGQFEPRRIKPEKCYGTDELMDRRCCIFPPFFNRHVARECGAIFSLIFLDKTSNVTGLRRDVIKNCEHWQCILKKYDLLNEDDVLNIEKYSNHLDKWVSLNRDFNTAITRAKVFCREVFRFFMPLPACKFFDYQSCIRNFVRVNCPVIIQSQQCFEWKQFYEECKEFYY